MTKASDVKRLADIARVMLDHRLGQLRSASAELERSWAQLAAINRPGQVAELDPLTAGKVALGYERWADQRRAELNLVIARQTATWIEARSDAQTALGRVQALRSLSDRLERRK